MNQKSMSKDLNFYDENDVKLTQTMLLKQIEKLALNTKQFHF